MIIPIVVTPPHTPLAPMRIVIESPYAGDVERNLRYLRACLRDSLLRGEAPFASHGLYTLVGVLDDLNPEERRLGINAGFAWRSSAEFTVFYTDLGWSAGMNQALAVCLATDAAHRERKIGFGWQL